MTLPKWLARLNRRFVNPRAVRRGRWPVLIHVGRKTGKIYRTPLDAHPIDDGYVFMVNYGPHTDWLRNALAAGDATLELGGESIRLTTPQLLPAPEAYALLPPDAKTPPAYVGVEECLVMREARVSGAFLP